MTDTPKDLVVRLNGKNSRRSVPLSEIMTLTGLSRIEIEGVLTANPADVGESVHASVPPQSPSRSSQRPDNDPLTCVTAVAITGKKIGRPSPVAVDIEAMLAARSEGLTQRQLALRFDVSQATLSRLIAKQG